MLRLLVHTQFTLLKVGLGLVLAQTTQLLPKRKIEAVCPSMTILVAGTGGYL
jgi:hypothetical protein